MRLYRVIWGYMSSRVLDLGWGELFKVRGLEFCLRASD